MGSEYDKHTLKRAEYCARRASLTNKRAGARSDWVCHLQSLRSRIIVKLGSGSTHPEVLRVCGYEQTLQQTYSREYPGSARCVQNFDDSLRFAIRITYRISLRSSSLWEPRHPLLKVFWYYYIFPLRNIHCLEVMMSS